MTNAESGSAAGIVHYYLPRHKLGVVGNVLMLGTMQGARSTVSALYCSDICLSVGKFETPSMFLECIKLHCLNLASGSTKPSRGKKISPERGMVWVTWSFSKFLTSCSISGMDEATLFKFPRNGCGMGHVTLFKILNFHQYFLNGWSYAVKFGKWIDYDKAHPKCKKFLPERGAVWVTWSFWGWRHETKQTKCFHANALLSFTLYNAE